MGNLSTKTRFILGILLLTAFIVGGSYLYKVIGKPTSLIPTTTTSQKTTVSTGLQATQKMLTDYPQFIKKTFIQQHIEDTLTAINANNWTLETGGKSLTISNQGNNTVRLTKLPQTASGSSQPVFPTEIKPQDLKIGDLVSITQVIDWQTGTVTITGITVLPPK